MEETALQPFRTRVESAPGHVLGEGGQARERLLDARNRADDEGAGTVAAHEEPVTHEIVDGFADGDAADIGVIREIPLRRQRISVIELARQDRLLERLPELQIERTGAPGLQGFERQNGGELLVHADTPEWEPKRAAASATAPVKASARASTKRG